MKFLYSDAMFYKGRANSESIHAVNVDAIKTFHIERRGSCYDVVAELNDGRRMNVRSVFAAETDALNYLVSLVREINGRQVSC